MKNNLFTLYTTQKAKNQTTEDTVGAVHGSEDGDNTVCGKKVEAEKWFIVNNTFDGIITCKNCLKILSTTTPAERSKRDFNDTIENQ